MFNPALAETFYGEDFSTPTTPLWFDLVKFTVCGGSLIGITFRDWNILCFIRIPFTVFRETILKHDNNLKVKDFRSLPKKKRAVKPAS